jgi:hypothetical protein
MTTNFFELESKLLIFTLNGTEFAKFKLGDYRLRSPKKSSLLYIAFSSEDFLVDFFFLSRGCFYKLPCLAGQSWTWRGFEGWTSSSGGWISLTVVASMSYMNKYKVKILKRFWGMNFFLKRMDNIPECSIEHVLILTSIKWKTWRGFKEWTSSSRGWISLTVVLTMRLY